MGISALFNELPTETKLQCYETLTEAVRPVEKSKNSSLYTQYGTLFDEWDFSYLDVQSEPTATDNTSTENVQAETLTFRDGALSERITMGDMSAGDYDADDDAIGGLSNFLSRPVRIHNFTWQESTFYNAGINPWHLYFNTAQIKKKLDNYGRIRCRLHLKFVLNASPFYFGSLRACYFPLPDQRSTYNSVVDQVPFSQVPGVYLEPQNMSTAEMVLPFLYPNNWLDATTAADFVNMGYLYFLQYANLRSANGVSGAGINISVYAWAEDVEVMGPTGTLAIQSQDEYAEEQGVISGPATAIANVASKLTDVPVVGTFARATEVGAKAVAGIAKMFGYSNPPMINDVLPYQPKAFHAFANVETRVPLDKLSIDPKNEVTISSKVTGIDEPDPLAFNNYLTHESFLLGTLWSGSTAVDTLLWSAMVNPGYSRNLSTVYTTTPAAYVSQMFRYWRGSIIYKFRIIKTQYHKGRLIISWDPTGNNTINADTETTTLTRIVDLELEDEVEFVVPYKATTPYLKTITTGGEGFSSNGAAPVYTLPNNQFCNGAITVRVQNVLTGPAASPSIDILGYVRCSDDFQFAVPIDVSTFWTTSDPTGVIQSEAEDSAIDGKKHVVDAQMAAITFGESYASLRPILHRTSLSTTQTLGRFDTGNAPINYVGTANFYYRFPEGYGRNAHGYSRGTIAATTVPWSTATNHPIDWILNSFVGVRGSTNIQFDIHSNGFNIDNISVARYFENPIQLPVQNRNAFNTSLSISNPGQLSNSALFSRAFLIGQTGASITNMRTQSALSVSVPQYTNSRFTLAFRNVRYNNIVTSTEEYDAVALRATLFNSTAALAATSPWPVVDVYYAAGVDFQPIMFLCTPRMFVNLTPTAFPTP